MAETAPEPFTSGIKTAQGPNSIKLEKVKRGGDSQFKDKQFNNFTILILFWA
jgi:hypothetical protein